MKIIKITLAMFLLIALIVVAFSNSSTIQTFCKKQVNEMKMKSLIIHWNLKPEGLEG